MLSAIGGAMKSILHSLRVTLTGGVFFALPVVLTYLLLAELVMAVESLAEAAGGLVGYTPPAMIRFPTLFAIGFLLLFSFIVGLALRAPGTKRLLIWFEKHILEKVPGYTVIRTLMHSLGGQAVDGDFQPVLVEQPNGARSVGFILEDLPDGFRTVFLPNAPAAGVGTVQVVPADRIEELDIPAGDVFDALSHWGFGLKDAFAASGSTPGAGARSSS
jgi:uncharacterized membrane protein